MLGQIDDPLCPSECGAAWLARLRSTSIRRAGAQRVREGEHVGEVEEQLDGVCGEVLRSLGVFEASHGPTLPMSTEHDDADDADQHERAGEIFGTGVAFVQGPCGDGESDDDLHLAQRSDLGSIGQCDGDRPAD